MPYFSSYNLKNMGKEYDYKIKKSNFNITRTDYFLAKEIYKSVLTKSRDIFYLDPTDEEYQTKKKTN